MHCPSLSDLPFVPGKTGWPWDVESIHLPERQPGGYEWPRISIITPSYNQGIFLEETIRSVLLQGYPNLEYIIMDGGSSDNSVEIIRKYEPWISFWVSEKDKGQSDAINKGFERARGIYGNWINSDDLLCQNAFHHLALLFQANGRTVYIGRCLIVDKNGLLIRKQQSMISSLAQLIQVPRYWRNGQSIAQQAAIYPIEAFMNAGQLTIDNHLSMDFELWGRFLANGYTFQYIPVDMGVFRTYPGQKISDLLNTTISLIRAAKQLLWESRFSFGSKIHHSINLSWYLLLYRYHTFRSKIGIKRRIKAWKNERPG